MKLICKIQADTKELLLRELEEMTSSVKAELSSPTCKNCKPPKGICKIGGGSDEPGLESNWHFYRATFKKER